MLVSFSPFAPNTAPAELVRLLKPQQVTATTTLRFFHFWYKLTFWFRR